MGLGLPATREESATGHDRRTRVPGGWRLVAGVLVLSAVVVTGFLLSTQDSSSGGSAPRGARPNDVRSWSGLPEPHELREIARIARVRTPEDVGYPDNPEPIAMELRGGIAYVAHYTDSTVQVTAIGPDGAVRWAKQVAKSDTVEWIASVSLVATPATLVVVVDETREPEEFDPSQLVALDLATGDTRWAAEGDVTHFVGGFMVVRRDGTDIAFDTATFAEVWSVPNPESAFTTVVEETWDLPREPFDPGPRTGVEVSANEADYQYVVMADLATGDTRVLDLATGTERTRGNLGGGSRLVAVEGWIFVHDGEDGEVRAYAVNDLGRVRWRASMPAGTKSGMWVCGREMLCVSMRRGDRFTVTGVDARTGRQRWRRDGDDVGMLAGDHLARLNGLSTDIIDTRTGEVRKTLNAPVFAQAGDGLFIGRDGIGFFAYDPVRDRSTKLGAPPDAAVVANYECEWDRAVVLCASLTDYVLFRYRG